MEALAAADALSSLSGNRHQSHWQTMALEDNRPLLPADTALRHRGDDDAAITAPALAEDVVADYQSTGSPCVRILWHCSGSSTLLIAADDKPNWPAWAIAALPAWRDYDLPAAPGHSIGGSVPDAGG